MLLLHIAFQTSWIFFAPCSPLEKGWNSKEEVLCLSPQGCVKAHKENGVQQAVHAAEVEGAGVLALAKLDDQVDDGWPPAEEESQGEDGEDEGHVDPLRPPLRSLHHLAQQRALSKIIANRALHKT